MELQARAKEVAIQLNKAYPDAKSELIYSNTMELAIAVALSAQTTDKKVNEITSNLFKKYKNWTDYANASLETITEDIRGVNFHKGKAQRLILMAQKVLSNFKGELPKSIKDLIQLPGVARKTANVILSEGFGQAEGLVVDTHVTRVSQRLGLTLNDNAVKIEQDLMKLIPQNYWVNINNSMVLHGRYVCTARKPKCADCVLNKLCPSAFSFEK